MTDFERSLRTASTAANAGYAAAGIEIVKCRVERHGGDRAACAAPDAVPAADPDAGRAVKSHRPVYFTERHDHAVAAVYDGDGLNPGMAIAGPAIVERMGDTIVVPTELCRRRRRWIWQRRPHLHP